MNRLSRRLAGDGAVVSAWLGLQDPMYAATIATLGFDAVAFDMQHNMATETSVVQGLNAIAASGLPGIVRIPVGRFEMASKALDAGAHMVIAPMVNSVEDARSLASFCKYPPAGERSYGVGYVSALFRTGVADYAGAADRETLCIAMIETVAALKALDDILAVDGIDGVFCGPSDLSISIADAPTPTPFGESSIAKVREIAEKARAAGKLACTYCTNAEHANLAHEMGYRYIALGGDVPYLRQGVDNLLGGLSFR